MYLDYSIYQIAKDSKNKFLSFNKDTFDFSDYDIVYYHSKLVEVDMTPKEYLKNHSEEILEEIFDKYNLDVPKDFTGHSLSVSDVVEINGNYYYCDSFGWKNITDEVKNENC